jgi:uncharacterized membrane protein
MGTLIAASIAAIAIGLTLLAAGGVGYQPVKVNLREGSILGQAWFIILVLGFTLIALDVYLTTMHSSDTHRSQTIIQLRSLYTTSCFG